MFIHSLLLVLSLLTWSTQNASGVDLNFSISEVRQCAPVSLTFSTDVKDSMNNSMTLAILPFGSAPIFIPVQNVASDYSQVSVNFIPLLAGNQFVASLDDANGQSIAQISDITKILPSSTNDSSCTVARALPVVTTFNIVTNPTQCEGMTVTYDPAVLQTAPRVRAYVPRGDALDLTKTADDGNGTAKYLINIERGSRILLLFQNDNGQNQQTTELLTVAGDKSTTEQCLTRLTMMNGTNEDVGRQPKGIPQAVIIGAAIGGATIILIAIAIIIYLLRDRKRKKRRTINSFFTRHFPPPEVIVPMSSSFDNVTPRNLNRNSNPFEEASTTERGNPNPNLNEGFILNPPYVTVMGDFEDSNDAGASKVSMSRSYSSWTHDEPNHRDEPHHHSGSLELTSIPFDIEGMLNRGQDLWSPSRIPEPELPMSQVGGEVQKAQVDGADLETLKAENLGSDEFGGSDLKTEATTIRHWRSPSDVPVGLPYSGSFSGLSILVNVHPNPFNEEGNNIMIHSPLIHDSDEPTRPISDNVLPVVVEHDEGVISLHNIEKSGGG